MIRTFKLAIATDDGKNLIKRHFGDADYYHIYEVNETQIKHRQTIDNSVAETEEMHADSKKARGIAQLLKKEGVTVAASKIFGPNIKRIIKRFACVILYCETIEEGLQLIQENITEIFQELDKGETRSSIKLK